MPSPECSKKWGGCQQEKLPVLVNPTGEHLFFPSLALELFFSTSNMGWQTMRPRRLLTCWFVPGAGLGGGDHIEWVHQPGCPNRGGRRLFPVVKWENNWHLQTFRWDKRPTAFPMASNGTLFCSMILWCSKRWLKLLHILGHIQTTWCLKRFS